MTSVLLATQQVAHMSHPPQVSGHVPATPAIAEPGRTRDSRIAFQGLARRFDQERPNHAAGNRKRGAANMTRQTTRAAMKTWSRSGGSGGLSQHVEHRPLARIDRQQLQLPSPGNPRHRNVVIEVDRSRCPRSDQTLVDCGLGIDQQLRRNRDSQRSEHRIQITPTRYRLEPRLATLQPIVQSSHRVVRLTAQVIDRRLAERQRIVERHNRRLGSRQYAR